MAEEHLVEVRNQSQLHDPVQLCRASTWERVKLIADLIADLTVVTRRPNNTEDSIVVCVVVS